MYVLAKFAIFACSNFLILMHHGLNSATSILANNWILSTLKWIYLEVRDYQISNDSLYIPYQNILTKNNVKSIAGLVVAGSLLLGVVRMAGLYPDVRGDQEKFLKLLLPSQAKSECCKGILLVLYLGFYCLEWLAWLDFYPCQEDLRLE